MEILSCEKNGVSGWKYGESGECFIGVEAYQRAKREQMKEMAENFKENPAPIVRVRSKRERADEND